MAVFLHSSTRLPLPAYVVASSQSQSLGVWLLTMVLFLLLIVGRLTSYAPVNAGTRKAPAGKMVLPQSSFQPAPPVAKPPRF